MDVQDDVVSLRQAILSVAIICGLGAVANGGFMLIDPAQWYFSVPGVTSTGPFNQHFVRDIGMTFILVGAGFVAGALRRHIRSILWPASALWLSGHALFHAWEVAVGICGPSTFVRDFPLVTLPALIAVALAVWAIQEKMAIWSPTALATDFHTGAEPMNILHIDASASDAATSHTRRLSTALVERLKAANPGATVVYRDVVANQLPHVDMTIQHAWNTENGGDATLAETIGRSKTLVDELKAADVVVVGSPMYNFSVPSTLKSWIDHVAIAGQTFSYTADGPRGLLIGKAYLVLSSGGIYTEGPFAPNDHLSTYLEAIFRFLGIDDVQVVRAEGIAYGPEQDQAAMASAAERIDAIAAAV